MLAVLDAGPGSALSGASAGAWWGIPGNLLKPWHVVRQRDQTNRPFVRKGQAHEPTLFDPDQIVELDGVPVVVPARALFDVAGTMRRGAEKPDRKSTRLNSSHKCASRMPSSACKKKQITHTIDII